MFKLPTSVSRNQSDMYASKEAVQELLNQVEEFKLINKELTGLVFRLANNIYSLQTQIDDVKEDFKTNSDRITSEVVAKIRADLDGYLDGQLPDDNAKETLY